MANKEVKKPQTMIYSDEELTLIKRIFADNDELPTMLRKAIIQWPLTDAEIKILHQTFPKGSDSLKLLKKVILPEIDGNAPLQQIVDLWLTLKFEEKSLDGQEQAIRARKIVIDYLKGILNSFFEGIGAMPKPLDTLLQIEGIPMTEVVVNIIARNTLVMHTDFQALRLKVIAGTKEETPEAMKRRLEQDSNK